MSAGAWVWWRGSGADGRSGAGEAGKDDEAEGDGRARAYGAAGNKYSENQYRKDKEMATNFHSTTLQWEHERARRRGWQACFPCPAMGKYSSMLKYREANDVMLAWMKTQMLRM